MYNDQMQDAAYDKRQKLRDAVEELVRASLYLREMQFEGRGGPVREADIERAAAETKVEALIREFIPVPGEGWTG